MPSIYFHYEAIKKFISTLPTLPHCWDLKINICNFAKLCQLCQLCILEGPLIFENVEDKNPLCDHKYTPLHWAAMNGYLEICKYIVSKVENKNLAINSKTDKNETPLELAAQQGHQQVVDYLRSIVEN